MALTTTPALFAVVLMIAVFVAVREAESRLPPKYVKAALGVNKALYATNYGYSLIPVPNKLLAQARLPPPRTHKLRSHPQYWRRRRRRRRPPPGYGLPVYAKRYNQWTPASPRRPARYKGRRKQRRPQSPIYPDYYEQEIPGDYDDNYFYYPDYEDPGRVAARQQFGDYGYDREFTMKHADLYNEGYSNSAPKSKRQQGPREYYDTDISRVQPTFLRRPLPQVKSWTAKAKANPRPFSAAIGSPSRPVVPREEVLYHSNDEQRYRTYSSKPQQTHRKFPLKQEQSYRPFAPKDEQSYPPFSTKDVQRYRPFRSNDDQRDQTFSSKNEHRYRSVITKEQQQYRPYSPKDEQPYHDIQPNEEQQPYRPFPLSDEYQYRPYSPKLESSYSPLAPKDEQPYRSFPPKDHEPYRTFPPEEEPPNHRFSWSEDSGYRVSYPFPTSSSQGESGVERKRTKYGEEHRTTTQRYEPDIGFGQGLEVVDDRAAGWKAY